MDKWDYFEKIKNYVSNNNDRYENYLEDMMDKFRKINLQEITFDEAKYYYEKLKKEV